jgi:chemotaxis protein MotB
MVCLQSNSLRRLTDHIDRAPPIPQPSGVGSIAELKLLCSGISLMENEPVQENGSDGEWRESSNRGSRGLFRGIVRQSSSHLWLISYSDFMTILMIFFLAMYGYTYLAKAALLKIQNKPQNYSEFTRKILEIQKKMEGKIKVQEDTDKVVVQLSEKILFPSGQASLSNEAQMPLEELANSLKLIDGDVIVEGHTDNVPVKGSRFKSNWELSVARSFSVIRALTSKGVPPGRLAAWGFGENRPLIENTNEENRFKNRRIEVVILKKKQLEGTNGG